MEYGNFRLSTEIPRVSYYIITSQSKGLPDGSAGEESTCNTGDPGSTPGSGRSPGEGNGNPLQYSRLEKSMNRGALWATVHEAAKSRTH